jgi:hypothetical protein
MTPVQNIASLPPSCPDGGSLGTQERDLLRTVICGMAAVLTDQFGPLEWRGNLYLTLEGGFPAIGEKILATVAHSRALRIDSWVEAGKSREHG